mmetsp:Transcript_22231/g.57086  ORF Transcript_22231/g.57086 Transcript_22231/m.57086 type:complete len:330 (+) Transcript_22231:2392-3381(+)
MTKPRLGCGHTFNKTSHRILIRCFEGTSRRNSSTNQRWRLKKFPDTVLAEAAGVVKDIARLRKVAELASAPAFRAQSDAGDAGVQLRAQLRALALNGSPALDASELRTLSKLGEGAFAEVELCEVAAAALPRFGDALAGAPRGPGGGALVAVKWLRTHFTREPDADAPTERVRVRMPAHEEANFFAEAALLRTIRHPAIIAAHGCYVLAQSDAMPPAKQRIALVLDYAAGGALNTRLRQGSGHTCAQALTWLCDLASALAFLHETVGHSTIVHRDVKPENVLISADGHAKLADFSLFRALPKIDHGRSWIRALSGTQGVHESQCAGTWA